MSIREKLNNSPVGSVGVAVVVLAVATGVAYVMFGGVEKDPANSGKMFYDLTSDELVFVPAETLSPHQLPSGNTGVEAVMYACGECPEALTMDNVVYLRRLSPKAEPGVRKGLESGQMDTRIMDQPSLWEIASVEQAQQDQWVSEAANNPTVNALFDKIATFCDGQDGRKQRCFPYQ